MVYIDNNETEGNYIMTHDFNYYAGVDLPYPKKPTKPTLSKAPNGDEYRAHGDAIDQYNVDLDYYEEQLSDYRYKHDLRMSELKAQIRNDLDVSEAQFDLLWVCAKEDDHSGSLSEVVADVRALYDMASKFAALEKN